MEKMSTSMSDSSEQSGDGFQPAENRISIKTKLDRTLICVDYPAVVNNLDRAFQTFDGVRGVEKAYKDESKRLELRWRPDNMYCKPVYGDRVNTNNILLKVTRRRKPNSKPTDDKVEYEYKVEFEGFIFTTYRFNAIADFQYLPVEKREDQSMRNLLTDLHLSGLTKREEFMSRDVPLFFPPMIFSRIDTPVEYKFRPDTVANKMVRKGLEHLPAHIIGTGRMKRTIHTIFQNFEDNPPTGPPEAGRKFLEGKLKNTNLLQIVQDLFEQRPIWSKNGIRNNIEEKFLARLKFVLPLVAYYYCTGPWRTLWVKFGYDPRKDKGAKIYQVLDFRVRQRGGAEKLEITGKRSAFDYILPTLKSRSNFKTPKIVASALGDGETGQTNKSGITKSTYIYDPQVLPPFRQMFYQFCDINVEEIQKMVHANDGKEETCSEREGWCLPDIFDKSREIIFKLVDKLLGKQLPSVPEVKSKHARSLVNKIRGMVEMPVESDDSDMEADTTDVGGVDDDEELNEMETEIMDCV